MLGLVLLAFGVAKRGRVRVCKIEVVGQFGMLRGDGGDALYGGQDAALLALLAHLQVLLLHVRRRRLQHETCYLEVAKTGTLYF